MTFFDRMSVREKLALLKRIEESALIDWENYLLVVDEDAHSKKCMFVNGYLSGSLDAVNEIGPVIDENNMVRRHVEKAVEKIYGYKARFGGRE